RVPEDLAFLKEPAGFAAVQRGDANYWSVPRPSGRAAWRDDAPHSYRGIYRTDPVVARLQSQTFTLTAALAKLPGMNPFAADRLVTPLRRQLEDIDRQLVRWRNGD